MSLQRLFFTRPYYWKYLALAWFVCLLIWWYSARPIETGYVNYTKKEALTQQELLTVFSMYHKRHPSMKNIKTRSTAYDEVLRSVSMYDFLKKSLFDDRCMVYFNHLERSNPEWLIHPAESLNYNKDAFQLFDKFKESKMKAHEKETQEAKDNNRDPPPEIKESDIHRDYQELWNELKASEQKLHDYLAHVRIFDKCYIQSQDSATRRNDTDYVKRQQYFLKNNVNYLSEPDEIVDGQIYRNKLSCSQIEAKIFPWLTMEYPEFTRYDNQKSYFPGNNYKVHENRGCFLNDFKSRLNGKGFVLTIGDQHVEDAIRLIKVLRFLGNKYPIQFIYHSGLSDLSKQHLIKAARIKFENYPTQEIWFVDISRSIDKSALKWFGGFANKVLATLFNTFEEMILVDADTVLLQTPEYFFKLKKYIDSGTMFYKDRSAFLFREKENKVLFQKLMPSLDDAIVFNINQITNKTLDNEFFQEFYHYMESGLVVINRKKHFIQPFMMTVLSFYHPITERLYGDKELFWLALVLAGDENYEFNDHFAAAIGELTPETERHNDINQIKSFKSKELCSAHPGHISDVDNQTLAWINSGFRFCGSVGKGVDFQQDFDRKKRFTKFKTLQEFETFYRSKLQISHAVIPPYDIQRKKAKNIEHEPETAWTMTDYCKSYVWCSYSTLGGYYEEDGQTKSNLQEGKVIEFTGDQRKWFEEVGDIWMMETGLYV